MLSNQSKAMRQAMDVLANISAEEKARIIAEAEEKALKDQVTRENSAWAEGFAESYAEACASFGLPISDRVIAEAVLNKGLHNSYTAYIIRMAVSKLRELQREET